MAASFAHFASSAIYCNPRIILKLSISGSLVTGIDVVSCSFRSFRSVRYTRSVRPFRHVRHVCQFCETCLFRNLLRSTLCFQTFLFE
jgi:hypothetical protein